MRVVLHSTCLGVAPGPTLEVSGTRGGYVKHGLDTQEGMLKHGRTPGDEGWGEDHENSGKFTPVDEGGLVGEAEVVRSLPGNYLAYYEKMGEAVLNEETPPPVTGEEGRRVMEVLELGFKSSQEGRRIDIPPLGPGEGGG